MTKPKETIKGSKKLANANREIFCLLFSGYNNREMFGNGTQCYLEAYGLAEKRIKIKDKIEKLEREKPEGFTIQVNKLRAESQSHYNSAVSNASRLLINDKVRERADFLISQKFNNEDMDNELSFVAMQRRDLSSKIAAIKEYNRVKDRVSDNKIEGEVTFKWQDPYQKEKKKK